MIDWKKGKPKNSIDLAIIIYDGDLQEVGNVYVTTRFSCNSELDTLNMVR